MSHADDTFPDDLPAPPAEVRIPLQALRGRGTASSMAHRFSRDVREVADDGWGYTGTLHMPGSVVAERRAEYAEAAQDGEAHGWHSSGLIAPATRVHLETARSALCANDSPDIFFELSVNPYRGCEHGCIYCYARPTHSYLNFSPGLDFETQIVAKHNIAEVLRSELAVETWIRLAREAGCAQLFNCPVSAIHHHADGITIDTLDGEYHGKKLLVSAGTWVTRLLPDLPIQPVRMVFAWYQADGRYSSKNHFPAFTGELPNGDQYYGFPAEDNELKIGKHNGGQPVSTPQERSAFGAVASDGSESFPFLRNVLPGIGGCLHGASCTYDNTVDEDFIIDTLPGRPDTLLITGLSGHGFKFAPVLGEIASQFAQGETSSFNLAPFSLARFNA